ncbi:A disintegrin and metalloproteinase with thrombospondin motifs adt-2-like [Linepithema humile]|uniref:A disintegrin and metalloproteinase with thrombospondin motifs adt-2-like n=1 Tax=Linepithema humile TaxID=83485 RepID=UPI0006237B83|nr:PREDICTED: uncharacterized protein LOC105679148 [Linepithema humile]
MFSLLKLMIIILLNETYAHITYDIETILLPASNLTGAKEISITLKVFGKLIQLHLRRSDKIVSPAFKEWKYNVKGVTEKLFELNVSSHCFYYHEDHISSAAINFCHQHGLKGLVFMENDTLEIWPLRNEFTPICLIDNFRRQTNLSFGKLYAIKRSLQYLADLNLYYWDMFKLKRRHVRNAQQNLTMELAVFIDEAAYHMCMFIQDNDEDKLRNIIVVYVNRIQAAFNRPNLNVFINITLLSLNILRKQTLNLLFSNNEAGQRLDSFCKYANSLNPTNDDDPNHWDISLYLTGVDLYADMLVQHEGHYRDEKNFEITGCSNYEGVCDPLLSCAIAEFRDKSEVESSLNAIQKIGDLLGLKQEQSSSDSQMNITWSEYSREKSKKFWERKTCLRDQAKTMISKKKNVNSTGKNLTIELAVFFDEAAYYLCMRIPTNYEDKFRNMILAYVNRIQAAFNRPNLNVSVNITLLSLNFLRKQKLNLPFLNNEAVQVLDSFCKYANSLNPTNDDDPNHWDISLYLTGVDLYADMLVQHEGHYRDEKNFEITGCSNDEGVCDPLLSCAIVEFRNQSEVEYSFTAIEKIGQLLGLKQEPRSSDSQMNITWSEYSREKSKKLWERKTCLRDQAKTISKTENIDNDKTQ